MIEHSPVGAVPHTPTYQDALRRLQASHQVYPSADYKGGYVTVRSLAALPLFYANNLDAFRAGAITAEQLDPDAVIFDRYVASLSVERRSRAAESRSLVVARKVQHRAKHGAQLQQDPAHTLFLMPGTGAHPGLPGNYLHGSLYQAGADPEGAWGLQVHDAEDGVARCTLPTRAAALEKFQELVASAPFQLAELDALGFHSE
jgi:hypothetical protein